MAGPNGRSRVAETTGSGEDNPATVRLLGMTADEFEMTMTQHEVDSLQERIAELEFMTEDAGWQRIGGALDLDLSREHLQAVIRDAMTMYLANPLINHAVDVMAVYVFGQGVTITGRGIANDRVQAFLTDRGNVRVLTGQAAMVGNDRALSYEGNRFFALFGKRGEVTRVRVIPTAQIVAGDIITNPEDDSEPWYYARRWTKRVRDERTGAVRDESRVDYYPDVYYAPTARPERWGIGQDEGDVHWDSPVIHIKDGGLTGGRYGIPGIWSALSWARAVSRDLSDYATVKRALARFAWKVVTKTRAGARSTRERLQSSVTSTMPRETNPPPETGSAFVAVEGNDITPLKTAGAAPNPEEGRRLGLMVGAGAGLPETILFGNADAGNLATAKTLDRPTELMMSARQGLWADLLTEVISYDLRRAREEDVLPAEEPDPDAAPDIAPVLDVSGLAVTDPAPMRPVELVPDVEFVDILEDDVVARVGAIISAATLDGSTRANTMPDDLLTRLLLTALGVEDVDEVITTMYTQTPDPFADLLTDDDAVPAPAPLPETQFAEALDAFTASLVNGGGREPGEASPSRRGRKRRPQSPT